MEESRIVSPEVPKKEIKWNKERENKFREMYGNRSRSLSKKQQKSA